MSNATRVLTNVHLFDLLGSFQDGIYSDLLPIYSQHHKLRHFWSHLKLYQKNIGPIQDERSILLSLINENRLDLIVRLLRCRPHIDYTETKGRYLGPTPMDSASALGHLEILEYLHTHNIGPCTTSAMDSAASNGHLKIVQFLHYNRQEGCTVWALNWASENGHFHIIQFLLSYRKEGFTSFALYKARENHHMKILSILLN